MKLPRRRETLELPPPKNLRVLLAHGTDHNRFRGNVGSLTDLTWWTDLGQDRGVPLKKGEMALAGFFTSQPMEAELVVVGTPGDFRALLIDLLAQLMEID